LTSHAFAEITHIALPHQSCHAGSGPGLILPRLLTCQVSSKLNLLMLFVQFDPETGIAIRWAHCRLEHLSAALRSILAMAESWLDRLVCRRCCCAGTMTSVCCGCHQSVRYKCRRNAWRPLDECLT